MKALLNAKELAAELGISKSSFHAKRKVLASLFEVSRPIGTRRYSLELVRRYQFGQSMALIGPDRRPLKSPPPKGV